MAFADVEFFVLLVAVVICWVVAAWLSVHLVRFLSEAPASIKHKPTDSDPVTQAVVSAVRIRVYATTADPVRKVVTKTAYKVTCACGLSWRTSPVLDPSRLRCPLCHSYDLVTKARHHVRVREDS